MVLTVTRVGDEKEKGFVLQPYLYKKSLGLNSEEYVGRKKTKKKRAPRP